MPLPADATKQHLDSSTDDPKQARPELADLVDKFNAALAVLRGEDFVDVASAATTPIGAAAGYNVRITGTTTITAFDSVAAGVFRKVRFAGALTLTHNAASLILPGLANIPTAADDTAEFISLGAGNWLCLHYKKANGQAVVASQNKVVQEVYVENGAIANTSNNIPADNSIPQITEGDDCLTLAITPQDAANILIIRAIVNIGEATSSRIAALFIVGDSDALAVGLQTETTSSPPSTVPLQHRMVAGTTDEITFQVRFGSASGTAHLNSQAGNANFGGRLKSSLHIMEVRP